MNVQEQYGDIFDRLEERYALPRGYLSHAAQIESGFNPRSHNELSGADGLFQFTPSTARTYGLRYGIGPGSTGDPVASAEAAARYAADNQEALRRVLGRDPTAGELYVAHQQGGGGASALMANPDLPAGRVVPARNIALNAGNPRTPASQFVRQWSSKFPTATTMPFTSDDDLVKELGGGNAPAAAKADRASANVISDDDLIKELSGSQRGITVQATPVPAIAIRRKAQPGEEVKTKAAPEKGEETPAEFVNRVMREHQGSSLKDFGARAGAELLRGVGDVADTLGTGIASAGRLGANALSNVGVISPETRQSVADWAGSVEGRIAGGNQAYEAATAKSPWSPFFRGAGQAAATAPLIYGAAGAMPAEASAAMQAIAQRSPTVARILQGAGVGATSSALTSSASDQPLASQILLGGALGGGIGGAVSPLAGATGRYLVDKAKNVMNMFTEPGLVRTATRILQGDNPNIAVDAREIIPGSTPTLAEATGDPATLRSSATFVTRIQQRLCNSNKRTMRRVRLGGLTMPVHNLTSMLRPRSAMPQPMRIY